jgi:hypothetical protein
MSKRMQSNKRLYVIAGLAVLAVLASSRSSASASGGMSTASLALSAIVPCPNQRCSYIDACTAGQCVECDAGSTWCFSYICTVP